jgi:2-hydroxychromene-2-carboxylate isomerase
VIDKRSLTVCIDFKNPEAYLAWSPTRAMAKEQNIVISWLPFIGPQPKTPEQTNPVEQINRGAQHRLMRFQYRQQNLIRYSPNANLTLASLNRIIDSQRAAVGLLWCLQDSQTCAEQFIDNVFTACWQRCEDIANQQVVSQAISHAGANIDKFKSYASETGLAELSVLRQELEQLGVFDTPFYLLQGESFLGRQHIPMIKWLLRDKQGQKPI